MVKSFSWSQRTFAMSAMALLCFSVVWVWHVGHRGLFMLDQSIVFDGAWRIAQGQTPYRDFYLPFGPVTFLLPALIFHWTGPTFSSLVAAACVTSLVATALSLRLTIRLTESRGLAILAGSLTAVWFQAPFAVPWMEQTAFLFDLLALLLLVESRFVTRGRQWFITTAGAASALAILSKQNAGGLFVAVCLGTILVARRRRAGRDIFVYAAGGASVAAAFFAWLVLRSDLASFRHYWLEVSTETGISRIETWKLVGTAFFQTLVSSSAPLFIFTSVAGAVTLGLVGHRPGDEGQERLRLCGWLSLALPQFHNAFQLTTNNDAPNNNAFVGVCLATGLYIVTAASRWAGRTKDTTMTSAFGEQLPRGPTRMAGAVLAGLTLYSLVDGLLIARDRNVQEFFGARFEAPVRVARAAGVTWGEPTQITPHFCGTIGNMCRLDDAGDEALPRAVLERQDFEQLAAELSTTRDNFFVFPDTTMLYGLTGHISPQPMLYFHPGQSYLPSDTERLDAEITTALKRNRVQLVVLERASFMGTQRQLKTFPRLTAWLEQEFTPLREFGNYRLLRRRS